MLLEYNSVYSAVCRSRKKGLTSCLNRHKTLYKPHLYTQHYNWYLKQVYEKKKLKRQKLVKKKSLYINVGIKILQLSFMLF